MDDKIEIHSNPSADVYRDTKSVIIIDDDISVNRMLCMAVIDEYPDIIALGATHPEKAILLFKEIYFDVMITDINMPGLQGDLVIEQMRNSSPTTFIMAMTGHTMETAFIAGRAKPDFFLDKNKGFDNLLMSISKGIDESDKKQKNIISTQGSSDEMMSSSHWRIRKKLKQSLGFPIKKIEESRRLIKALSILASDKGLTHEEIAFCTGFSSYQRLKTHFNNILPLLNLT